jgi:uncharacterized integral membrane protein
MGIVRVLSWLIWAALFVVLFLVGIKNADPVTLKFFFNLEWSMPLILLLLITFAGGAILGLIACLPPLVRQRREIGGLKKEMSVRTLEQSREPTPPPAPDLPMIP